MVRHAPAGAPVTMSFGVSSFLAGAAATSVIIDAMRSFFISPVNQIRHSGESGNLAFSWLGPRLRGDDEQQDRRYRPRMYTATLMLLGSGELGREFAIAAKDRKSTRLNSSH